MPRQNTKNRVDYSKVNSDTPPTPSSATSNTSMKEPQEPCNPSVSFLKQVDKMTDKEVVDHLTKDVPELKDEALFLFNCLEKIGMEPLRDILINQSKTWRQATIVIKALVTGLRAGLNYSLREQHKTYLEMFNDMTNVITESSRLMTEVSQSLSETLKNENKESGKTLSALKEVLGNAHELIKTLTEGKTHGHLQVPAKPPKPTQPETKTKQPEMVPSPDTVEKITTQDKIKESVMCMDRSKFTAAVDCKGDHIIMKTRVCGIDYNIVYSDKHKKWFIRKSHEDDVAPRELIPYFEIFQKIVRDKKIAKKQHSCQWVGLYIPHLKRLSQILSLMNFGRLIIK